MSILHPFTWFTYNRRGVLPPPDGTPIDPVPVGALTMFVSDDVGTPSVPYGWLLCNGGTHATTTYPDLAAIIASPGAPGVNFSVPNMSTRVPVGAGTRPVKSSGGSSHNGSLHLNNSLHSHTNNHWHTVSNHSHTYHHSHGAAAHTHQQSSYVVEEQTSFSPVATGTAPLQDGAFGATAGTPHFHLIPNSQTSSSVQPVMLNYRTDLTTNLTSSGNALGNAVALDARTIPLNADSNLLPPYLNVYYIVKAIDFTGEYI